MSYSETITRTDLANILNEVLPVTSKVELEYVGTVNQIHWSQWTAPDDGIIIMDVGWLTNGGFGYYYVQDATEGINVGKVTTYSVNGTSNTTSFPVIKGHTYKDSAIQNVEGTAFFFRYYKFKNPTATCGMEDFVVEQGTDGDWIYRKWNSGIAECWCKKTATTNSSGTYNFNFACPTFFISTQPIYVTGSAWSSGYTTTVLGYVNTAYSSGSWRIDAWLVNGNASASCGATFKVIGKWK